MQVFDKAKRKAERAGVKRSSVRLEDDEASESGLPFPAPPRNDGQLTIPKVAGAIAATVIAAALVSLLAGSMSGSNGPDQTSPSPSASPAAPVGADAPSTNAGDGTVIGLGQKNNSGAGTADNQSIPVLPLASLEGEVQLARIRTHLESLYEIAQEHDGNRAMGNSGYNASVHYVLSALSSMRGFQVSVHDFSVAKNKIDPSIPASLLAPLPTAITKDTDFSAMANSGFGNVTGILIPSGVGPGGAPQGKSTGCNATDDFGAVTAAAEAGISVVALVERGSCFFARKMINARAAGAKAVLIYNADGGSVFSGTLGSDGDLSAYLPALGLSSALGHSLLDLYATCPWSQFSLPHGLLRESEKRLSIPGMRAPDAAILQERRACEPSYVNVMISGEFENITSSSVIAESVTGDDSSIIVVGAHLDSVEAGPGINDNGSGSSTILEIARALSTLAFPVSPSPASEVSGKQVGGAGDGDTAGSQVLRLANRVRFCWWGGEESGLLGSRAYVKTLNETGQLSRVAANLNFDMLASPNFKTGVYNGTDADKQEAGAVSGSTYIMQTFTSYFEAQGKPWTPSAFTGRSDYGPFLEMGIPAGGLDTGAEGIKGIEERKVFGGLARAAFDPCYHQDCDDIFNVDMEEMESLARAVAHTLQRLVTDGVLRQHLRYPVAPRRHSARVRQRVGREDGRSVPNLPFQGHHRLY